MARRDVVHLDSPSTYRPKRRTGDPELVPDDPYLMANLFPEDTGLPMVVWISERGRSRHDVRVKVSREHGSKARYDNAVPVSVRPEIKVMAGPALSPADMRLVTQWVELNRGAIIEYWDGQLSTKAVLQRLLPLPS